VFDSVPSFKAVSRNPTFEDNKEATDPSAPRQFEVREMGCSTTVMEIVKWFLYQGTLRQTDLSLIDAIECLKFAERYDHFPPLPPPASLVFFTSVGLVGSFSWS
jgi:hypothetical protein